MSMTREEARIEIQSLKDTFEELEPGGTRTQFALKIALSALRPVSRERVERIRGEWIELEPEIGLLECSKCGHKILRAKCNFCPACGAPMTNEAVQMVMERLEALYGDR